MKAEIKGPDCQEGFRTEGICIDQWFLSFLWLRRTWGIWHCVLFDWAQLLLSPLVEIPAVSVSPAHLWLPFLSSERPGNTGHGCTLRQCSSGKLYSLELCCLSILCSCLSKSYISHWELLGETTLCGVIFSINSFLWVDEGAAVFLYWGHILFRSQFVSFHLRHRNLSWKMHYYKH